MEVWEQYTTELYDQFGHLATWFPNDRVALGMVGTLENGRFEYVTTLEKQGIQFEEDVSPTAAYDHRAGAEMTMGVDASLTVAPAGKAAATIKFTSLGAFVFQAKSCTVRRFSDKKKLAREIVAHSNAHPENAWDSRWVIVDSVVHSKQLVVLVAGSADASMVLTGDADLESGVWDLAGAAARGGLSASYSKGNVTQIIAKRNEELTPLFRLIRLQPRHFGIFGPKTLVPLKDTGEREPLGAGGPAESGDEPFSDVEFAPGICRIQGLPEGYARTT